MDATPAANASHMPNEHAMPESLIVLHRMLPLGVAAHMVHALRAYLARRELCSGFRPQS